MHGSLSEHRLQPQPANTSGSSTCWLLSLELQPLGPLLNIVLPIETGRWHGEGRTGPPTFLASRQSSGRDWPRGKLGLCPLQVRAGEGSFLNLGCVFLDSQDPLWLSTEVYTGSSYLAAVLVMAPLSPGPGWSRSGCMRRDQQARRSHASGRYRAGRVNGL